MLRRLLRDRDYQRLDKKHVRRVVLLTGTNFVDGVRAGSISIDAAKSGIENICYMLWSTLTNAKLFVVNLLPRECYQNTHIVDSLNYFINGLCKTFGLIYINTEERNRLFRDHNGNRKERFFSDKVHLNKRGVSRLAAHLKFMIHNL